MSAQTIIIGLAAWVAIAAIAAPLIGAAISAGHGEPPAPPADD